MSGRNSQAKRRWRFAAIGTGIAFFLWLPFEDTQINPALGLAVVVCTLMAMRYLLSVQAARWLKALAPPGSNRFLVVLFYVLLGLVSGFAVTPAALMLMVFKSGVHAHPLPDFTPSQISLLIQRTPVWGLSGLLLGLGAGLRILNRR